MSVLKKFNTFKSYSIQTAEQNPAQKANENKASEQKAKASDAQKPSLIGDLEFEDEGTANPAEKANEEIKEEQNHNNNTAGNDEDDDDEGGVSLI